MDNETNIMKLNKWVNSMGDNKRTCRVLDICPRTLERWQAGESPVPVMLIRLIDMSVQMTELKKDLARAKRELEREKQKS